MTSDGRPPERVVGDFAERLMGYVSRYEERRDSWAVFAYLYLQLTRSLATGLAVGDPQFHDPGWVASLADVLAGKYFTASDSIDEWIVETGTTPDTQVSACELPDVVPRPWRDVYAAISGNKSYVLEDALFSMMAHISYDLPVALQRMSEEYDVRLHIADFHRMNDVLGTAVDFVQEELAGRYCSGSPTWTGSSPVTMNCSPITVSGSLRGMAWLNFNRLGDPSSPGMRSAQSARAPGRSSSASVSRAVGRSALHPVLAGS